MSGKRCDFHMHTTFSDGELIPMELIRRAVVSEHRAVALTDHASFSSIEWIVEHVAKDCEKASAWGIEAVPGVELTHIPVRHMDEAVALARKAGAQIIVVHGETPVEPVEPGTNHAAVLNGDVDILAHPGLLSVEDAELARGNDIFIEITCRKGHSLSNGHVAGVALEAGARMLVNTDAHSPADLSTVASATSVARSAGLDKDAVEAALVANPEALLKRIGRSG